MKSARAMKDRSSEAVHLSNLGLAYFSLGSIQEAIELYQEALRTSQEIGDLGDQSADLGNSYYALGNMSKFSLSTKESITKAYDHAANIEATK